MGRNRLTETDGMGAAERQEGRFRAERGNEEVE